MKVDGYEVSTRQAIEQLACIVDSYPLWPGDTLSHGSATACELNGWTKRDSDGNWIPTAEGVAVIRAARKDAL